MMSSTARSAILSRRHKARGELNLTPLKFNPEMERPSDGPLLFPGKVLADSAGKRLFIADTGHNRIIQTNLDGAEPVTIGSGEEGFDDGESDKATFNRPQGMCLEGETLYVADTENHAIRAIDLKDHTVTTIAGIGSQARGIPRPGASGPAKTTPLCSPWDVIQLAGDKAIYIAMAGTHQIWKLDRRLGNGQCVCRIRSENIRMARLATANFAQPSGLATDGENLFVADSEVSGSARDHRHPAAGSQACERSSARASLSLATRTAEGPPSGFSIAWGSPTPADISTSPTVTTTRSRSASPGTDPSKSLVGSHKPGDSDDPPHFYEPGGLSATEDRLFVADTNNNKIRVVDLKTHAVKTLALEGLSAPPSLAPRPPSFPNARIIDIAAAKVSPGSSIAVAVSIALPKGYKLNEEVPLTYLVETPEKSGLLSSEVLPEGQKIKPPVTKFTINVPLGQARDGRRKDRPAPVAPNVHLQRHIEPLRDQELRLERASRIQRRCQHRSVGLEHRHKVTRQSATGTVVPNDPRDREAHRDRDRLGPHEYCRGLRVGHALTNRRSSGARSMSPANRSARRSPMARDSGSDQIELSLPMCCTRLGEGK